jgi:hypothetical protein
VLWQTSRIDDNAVPYLNQLAGLAYLDLSQTNISDAGTAHVEVVNLGAR